MMIVMLWDAADALTRPFDSFIRMLILAGQKSHEVSDAEWAEIDLVNRVWTLPARRAKNGREHTIPLSDPACAILESIPHFYGSPFVFTRRHQLRRRACVHPGRSDRPADFEHLPQVLRTEDGRVPARHILCRDGGRCPCCRRIVWRPWSDSPRASGARRRSDRHVELHDVAQYWISSPRGFSGVAVRHDRRHRHAADDEQADTRR